jgi:hypothetical protein
MEPVGEFTPCFLRVVARFSAHADPNILREDPLSPGILDMFFRKYPIIRLLAKREFICIKIAQIYNWGNQTDQFCGR